MKQRITRREFLQWGGLSVAAVTVGGGLVALNPFEAAAEELLPGLSWDKAPCRFCGTGCSVMVGVEKGKVVAVKGDPESPVNQGALCEKGYALPFIQYGADRLTKPMIRKKNGKYDKRGKLTEASWDEAMSLVAAKAKEAIAAKGPSAAAMFGSGQWTIWEGYAASKLWKAGLRSNSLEVNARHCMASAVTGFMTTFGIDEPMGSYDDFAHADVFILWGANMAEMHPILWAKITDRLLQNPAARLYNLTTMSNRSSDMAAKEILFTPQSDLALANGIARLLLKKGTIDEAFIAKHCAFKRGKENIGYGLEDGFKFKDEPAATDLAALREFVEPYTPARVQELSGVAPEILEELAAVYGDPKTKVMSLWCMGMNQHTRGTWINNLVYNLHLLTGKISSPGNSPFSLTGQPSACGTTREVGTFTHRLPADMVVTNPAHRALSEEIWGVPPGTIPDKPSYTAVEMLRALDHGDLLFFWSMTTNPFQSYPKLNRYRDAALKDGRFIVVSDVYPNKSTEVADVVLPAAMWVEKEGAFGNAERRTQFWRRMTDAPGEAKSDLWQLLEFAKRMGHEDLFARSFKGHAMPAGRKVSDASAAWGAYVEKGLFEEYRRFGAGHGHDLAPFDTYHASRGLRWPVIDGKETVIRFREGYDPYVPKGAGVSFYGNEASGSRAVIWQRPYEAPPEIPDTEYPFWLSTGRVIEHWHSGTMTRRAPPLQNAYPHATANLHPDDAARLGLKGGEKIRLTSRRGTVAVHAEIGGRVTPQKGMVYVPWFDENVLINELTLDAYCPISQQADFKKCAVRIERIS
ncbi:MAG: molybdopterin-dependent oxidoreductase [Elusimicrobiota bacterium]|nr:molybdopterin-dependent oxidoreductase [Elusimicrobiota bacterium]